MNLTDLLLEPDQEQGPADPIDRALEKYPLNRMLFGDGPEQIRERGAGKSERVMIRRAIKNLAEAGLDIDGPGSSTDGLPILDVQATFNREGRLAYSPDFNFSEQAGLEDRAAVQQALQEQGLLAMVTVFEDLVLVPQSLHRLRYSFDDNDIHWQLLTVDPIEDLSLAVMREWMAVDANLFRNPYMVREWVKEGKKPSDLVDWMRVDAGHFSQSRHIAAWQAAGADHTDAAEWRAAHRGLVLRGQVEAWLRSGMTLDDARDWGSVVPQISAVSIDVMARLLAHKPTDQQREKLCSALDQHVLYWSDLVQMVQKGTSLDRICEMTEVPAGTAGNLDGWAQTSMSATEISEWVQRDFRGSETARAWMDMGLTAEQAKAWRDSGVRNPSQAAPWIAEGLTLEDMLGWKDAHYAFTTFDRVRPWIEAGFDAEQTKSWAEIGIHQPEVVKQWKDIGPPFDTPEGVKPLRAEVITPKQARTMIKALREHGDLR